MQLSITYSPSVVIVAVVTELTLDCGDVGDAVSVAVVTLCDSVEDGVGTEGDADVLAVASVAPLTVVTEEAIVAALDAGAAVLSELRVTGVREDGRSDTPEPGVLPDANVVVDVAAVDTARVSRPEVTGVAGGELGTSNMVVRAGTAVLDNASLLEVKPVAVDASKVTADDVGDVGTDGRADEDVAGVPAVG